ncbi:cytochrome c [Desulfosediminicola flagellatus]|uniref:cytochrome c n=1 Tax=Desulfosediminicola flagellatus TaxID=2569541 RepID=UPI0010ACD451|nr:c-type cytochrome [Desulfosediminicola flagellatus]
MNYPVWFLPEIGGGTLIAIIAVFHVFISHFAVGGGLYLVMAEKKGLREFSEPIMEFTRRHARFFLLVTMVLGSISGVGIWFIIALVNPAATSYLIHNFVFGWAAEWVFFMVEIAAAFVYFYMFGRMDSETHIKVGYLYFFAAWMSLFLINGIIGVMLTPGEWATTGNFWQGFFNPSFWPSLLFRTCVAILLAGCYGYLTASWSENEEVRKSMTRFSGLWSLAALVCAVPAAFWYMATLPAASQKLIMGKSPTIVLALQYGLITVVALLAITLIAGIIRPGLNNRFVAIVSLICAFGVLGSFEWTREAARRPYVLNEVMYSNSIPKDALEDLNTTGFLSSALWVQHHEITPENRLDAGRELYIQQCYSCHTINGENNDLALLTEKMSYQALTSYIGKIHSVRYFMPPFAGTEEEAKALAAYLVGGLHGKDVVDVKPVSDIPGDIGMALFEENCSVCHAPEDIAAAFEGDEPEAISDALLTLDTISDEMEPFSGTNEERAELSKYIYSLNAAEPLMADGDGASIFENHCSACHEIEDVVERMSAWEKDEIYANLNRLEELSEEMPPFEGTDEEREKLALYIDSLKGEK